MSGSTDVLFVVYIRTRHLKKYSSISFQEFTNISKTNDMKKVIEDLNALRKHFSDETQTIISFIKDGIQNSIESNKSCKKRNEKSFLFNGVGQKN